MNDNPWLEKTILATALVSKKALVDIVNKLLTDYFTDNRNKIIFNAIQHLYENDLRVDTASIRQRIAEDNKRKYVSDEYLAEILISEITVNYDYILDNLKELFDKRTLLAFNSDIPKLVKDNSVASIITSIENKLDGIKKQTQEKATSVKDYADLGLEELLKLGNFCKTGLDELDKKIIGFFETELIVLGARPGVGKSALALTLAQNITLQDKNVLFFSLEMSNKETFLRILSARSNMDLTKIRGRKINEQDKYILSNKMLEIKRDYKGLYLYDNVLDLDEIINKVNKFQVMDDIGLVIVDYLQLIQVKSKEKRQEQIAQISRSLKKLAVKIKAPVVALSQLNRSVENRTNKVPVLSDLRESGAIEQDANMVLFLFSDESIPEATRDVIVAKNRNGSLGRVGVLFQENTTRFCNLRKE